MSVKVYGINHIAIEVNDVEKAVEFYQHVFDLEKLDEGEGDASLTRSEIACKSWTCTTNRWSGSYRTKRFNRRDSLLKPADVFGPESQSYESAGDPRQERYPTKQLRQTMQERSPSVDEHPSDDATLNEELEGLR
jgi:catechol-2,3-dioxygenase